MDWNNILQERQSCRAYDEKRAVEREKLEQCLAAARLSPSACNSQPYHFTVAFTPESSGRAGACTRSMGMNGFTKDVPVFVVISEDDYNATAAAGAKLKKQDYRSVDIGIAAAYFTAEAAALGLSTCFLGWFDEKKLAQMLHLSGRVRLLIAVGYAKPGDPLRKKTRKPLQELSTWL